MAEIDSQSSSGVSTIEFYRLVRSQIEHEDNLNSQRLSWLVASQSFLFTAYAIVVSNIKHDQLPWVEHQQRVLASIIPIVSLLTCLLIYATILAGAVAMRNLRKFFKDNAGANTDGLPLVQGYRLTQLFGQAGPLGLPPIFIAIWLALLASGSGA